MHFIKILGVLAVSFLLLFSCENNGSSGSSELPEKEEEIQLNDELIDQLENHFSVVIDEVIKQEMPNRIHQEIVACKTYDEMLRLPISTDGWLHEHLYLIRDEKMANLIEELYQNLKSQGITLQSGDVGSFIRKALWAKVQGEKFDLRKEIVTWHKRMLQINS